MIEVLSYDDYYFHPDQYSVREGVHINWDTPEALDWHAIRSDIQKLIAGDSIRTPYDSRLYEIDIGKRSLGRLVAPTDILLVEGMHAFFPEDLVSRYHHKIFLAASHEVRTARRRRAIMTDEYVSSVHRPMYEKYVRPKSTLADLVIDTDSLTSSEVCDTAINYLHLRGVPILRSQSSAISSSEKDSNGQKKEI